MPVASWKLTLAGAVSNFVAERLKLLDGITLDTELGSEPRDDPSPSHAPADSGIKQGRAAIINSDDESDQSRQQKAKRQARPRPRAKKRVPDQGTFVNADVRGFPLTFSVTSGRQATILGRWRAPARLGTGCHLWTRARLSPLGILQSERGDNRAWAKRLSSKSSRGERQGAHCLARGLAFITCGLVVLFYDLIWGHLLHLVVALPRHSYHIYDLVLYC